MAFTRHITADDIVTAMDAYPHLDIFAVMYEGKGSIELSTPEIMEASEDGEVAYARIKAARFDFWESQGDALLWVVSDDETWVKLSVGDEPDRPTEDDEVLPVTQIRVNYGGITR